MSFFYNRPTRLYLAGECKKISRLMRRRPLHKCSGNVMKFDERQDDSKKANGSGSDDKETVTNDDNKRKNENESDGSKSPCSSASSPNDSKESVDTLDSNKPATEVKKLQQCNLDKILKKLADRITTKLALNGNGNNTNGHHHSTSNIHAPTSYSLASHIANTINSTQPHQHVSPRKRILRELEKVSLEDTKRSRPKSISNVATNGNANISNCNINNNNNNNTFSNGSLNNMKINEKAPPPISRPISSYSITSLLAHNTSNNNNNNINNNNGNINSSASTGCNNNNINNNSINSNDSSSTSHYQQQQQRLSLNTSPTQQTPKSPPSSMHNNKRKSPNLNQSVGSPSQSPSPEHHAFHKYRPITTTPTSIPASSSPYNSSYHSPNHMRGSPSPHHYDRLRTTGNFHQHSPSSSHYGTSSPQQNYAPGIGHRDSSLSPNVERTSSTNNSRSTPTSIPPSSSGIRTVPKKTAALRQQFSSPTMESSNKINKPTTPTQNLKSEKPMDVDALLRPSALIPPPIPTLGHPAAQLSHYPYMYPPINYLPPAVPPYYPTFYNPAMMAAAAAAYRFQIPGFPQTIPPTASALSPVSNTPASSSALNYDNKNANGHPRSSSLSSSPPEAATHHPYVPTSPWNTISLTNHHHQHHSISSDGNNLIPKVKDEQSSGEYSYNEHAD